MLRYRLVSSHASTRYVARKQHDSPLRFSTYSVLRSIETDGQRGNEQDGPSKDSNEVKAALDTAFLFTSDAVPAVPPYPIGGEENSNVDGYVNEISSTASSLPTVQCLKGGSKTSSAPSTSRNDGRTKSQSVSLQKETKSTRRPSRKTQGSKIESLLKKIASLNANAQGMFKRMKTVSDTANGSISRGPSDGKDNTAAKEVQLPKTKPKSAVSPKNDGSKASSLVRKPIATQKTILETKDIIGNDLVMQIIDEPHPPVKKLSYDLDRVLFKQGAYNLQDPRTGVFNFDHYLQDIMPAEEFDFDSLGAFITSSKDSTLHELARKNSRSYVGSTSSMTSVLSHFHFLLSNFRPLNFARVSSGFPNPLKTFTEFTRLPASLYLKYKDGVYALDADKTFDRGTILSQLGQSMEKLLLMPKETYEHYRLSSPEKVPDEIKNSPEAYHYSTIGNFVCRSQLDGHHEWLPGTGVFDIKTRACVTIRMNQDNYKEMSGYQIKGLYGEWESYEREYVDMLRSTMLKYSLQVRMGRMDGIFVAFHNTEQIFGFQYIPLSEMDLALHGQENLALGDQEFKISMQMFSDVLDLATKEFPEQSIRFHFETRPRLDNNPKMYIFAEPMNEEHINTTKEAESLMQMEELREEFYGKSPETKELPSSPEELTDVKTSSDEPSISIEKDQQTIEQFFAKLKPDSSPKEKSIVDSSKKEQSSALEIDGAIDALDDPNQPADTAEGDQSQDSNKDLENYDMVSIYPKATMIFFPDKPSIEALFPLQSSLDLYQGVATRLGIRLNTTSRGRLTHALKLQAGKSRDSLDHVAVKLHVLIEAFWVHPVVGQGIETLKSLCTKGIDSNDGDASPLGRDLKVVIAMARTRGVDWSGTQRKIAALKKSDLLSPSNLRWLYLDILSFMTEVGSLPKSSTKYWFARKNLHLDFPSLMVKIALLDRPDFFGSLPKTSLSGSPLLAMQLEASNFVNGEPVKGGVSNIIYESQWPLPQEQHKEAKTLYPPPVNNTWKVQYQITRMAADRGRRVYDECKERRRRKFLQVSDPKDEFRNSFFNLLGKLSVRGRQDKKLAERVFTGRIKEFR